MVYWGGLLVAMFGIVAIVASPGRRTTLLSLAGCLVIFGVIWAATSSTCDLQQADCRQSLGMYEAMRMLTVGCPGVLVAVAGMVKLAALKKRAASDQRAQEFWSDIPP